MYDMQMAYLNARQQKWFEEHVRDYDRWVNFKVNRIIMQITPAVGSIVFHMNGKEDIVSLYFVDGRGKTWQPRSRSEAQELLRFTYSPEIQELNNRGFETVKQLITSTYGY